jgi:hypothetical protein
VLIPAPGLVSAQLGPRDARFGAVQSINAPQRAVEAGVGWERIIFPWAQIQPNGPDQMMPGYYTDAEIDQQAKRGIQLVGVVLYTPAWAATDPGKGGASVPRGLDRPPTDASNFFGRFMNRLATQYKGKVDTWIIWNEPDLIHADTHESPNWAGSEADYWLLLKVGYQAVKQANPNAKVLTAGFSYWHAKEAGFPPYLERMLQVADNDAAAKRNSYFFDGVPLHPYSNPLNSFAMPMLYQQILGAHGLKKPIWNVESNAVPWDDPIGLLSRLPFRVSLEEQSSYVVTSFALGLAAGVERMSVYKLRDEAPENGQYFGLVREDNSVRPAFSALKNAINMFAGAKKATYTWDGSGNPPTSAELGRLLSSNTDHYQFVWPGTVSQVAIEKDGQRVTVVWNNTPRPVVAVVAASAGEGQLVDALGRSGPIGAPDGFYRIYLDGARGNTDPRDFSLILNGGHPWMIVEPLAGGAPPSQPPSLQSATCYSQTGYCVANWAFADYIDRNGGVEAFGLPISREFDLQGARTQVFQRQVLRLEADGAINALDLRDQRVIPTQRPPRTPTPTPTPSPTPNPSGSPTATPTPAPTPEPPVAWPELPGERFKVMMIGRGLSEELRDILGQSAYYRQYDNGRGNGMNRPGDLPRSNLKDAFEPLP